MAASLRALDQVKDVLTAEIVRLEDGAARLKLLADGKEVTGTFPHVLLYNLGNFSTYLAYDAAPGQVASFRSSSAIPWAESPRFAMPFRGRARPCPGFAWDQRPG